MKLKKLDSSFYRENTHLTNAMDNYDGHWGREGENSKVRGYGIVIIKINNLTFAIPLRSNANRKACYPTKKYRNENGHNKTKGLDYSMALLISKASYIFNDPFRIPEDEKKKIQGKGTYIRTSFEKYVKEYVRAVTTINLHMLNSIEYRYTTLKHYHKELGLE